MLWQGRPVSARRDWSALRGQAIGIVFQEFNLLPTLTSLQNVELALMGGGLAERFQRERAEAALERVGMAGRAAHLPAEMSGGERQRVAIARALVRRPALLLADEPTGSLDSGNAEAIAALLLRLPEEDGMTLLMVTHDPALAARCPRRIRMHDGTVAADEPAGRARRMNLFGLALINLRRRPDAHGAVHHRHRPGGGRRGGVAVAGPGHQGSGVGDSLDERGADLVVSQRASTDAFGGRLPETMGAGSPPSPAWRRRMAK